jgi:formate dehydrogenase iron-sulfur subunit
MCSSRLAVGEAPACVQACPGEAISITIVDTPKLGQERANPGFLPGAPDPAYTLPTTQYRTSRQLPANMAPGDYYEIKPAHAHAHLPLVVMLVLTQLSVGGFVAGTILRVLGPGDLVAAVTPIHSLFALILGLLAICASTLHLGRPLYAWRAFVGLKSSWLSREIIVFGLFAGCAILYAGSLWVPAMRKFVNIPLARELSNPSAQNILGVCVALSGLAGVFCSVMIYQDTRRTFWRMTMTFLKFASTTALLGPATLLFTLMLWALFAPRVEPNPAFQQVIRSLYGALVVTATAKLSWEAYVFSHLRDAGWTNMKRTALLMAGQLKWTAIGRFLCGTAGGILVPLFGLSGLSSLVTAISIFALLLIGELLERYLFFTAVIPPKMPGGIAS